MIDDVSRRLTKTLASASALVSVIFRSASDNAGRRLSSSTSAGSLVRRWTSRATGGATAFDDISELIEPSEVRPSASLDSKSVGAYVQQRKDGRLNIRRYLSPLFDQVHEIFVHRNCTNDCTTGCRKCEIPRGKCSRFESYWGSSFFLFEIERPCG